MTKKELAEIIESHGKWLFGEPGGTRAVLRDADLRDADLRDADLRGADLTGAVKIKALVAIQGNYPYEIWAYVSSDGVPYVRMGCLTYTIQKWDEITIERSNVSEFPDDGSPKSLARVRAFRFAREEALILAK